MTSRISHEPTEVTLPITPMLDMTFQLMFFFLATFNPSSTREGQMSLHLQVRPEGRASDPVNQIDLAIKEKVEAPTVVNIHLRGYKDPLNRGLVSYMTINTDNIHDEELRGNPDQREETLKRRLEGFKPLVNLKEIRPAPTVRMAAESEVRWSQIMKIMDVCYRTGYRVSFVTPSDLNGGG